MEKKFILTDKFIISYSGKKLFQLKCVKTFEYANAGDLGGYVEKEENLSQNGDAWICDNACVSGNARVSGDARVYGNAWVSGYARVYGNAWVADNAQVAGNAQVYGNAWVAGDAQVSGDAWVYDNAHVAGDAQVAGDARVYGDVWVAGDAQVSGDARVYGNAWVAGNAQVSGDAWIYSKGSILGNAYIDSNDKHCGFDCFGSENRHTHAYMTTDGEIEITCGCFRGSLEEFLKKVELTHKGTIYEKQYKAMIEVIKVKFGVYEKDNV